MADFKDLLGKTITKIEGMEVGSDKIIFTLNTGDQYKLYHEQGCCESVAIEDVCGVVDDLIGSPITMADESSSGENPDGVTKGYQDSFTWTFYKLATFKGFVDVRWYGESNGYYSESVDFAKIN